MYPYTNIDSSLIRYLIFNECSVYLKEILVQVTNFSLTVFRIDPYSNLKISRIRSLIVVECSLYLKKSLDGSLELASDLFQDVPLLKFRKFPDSFSYIY